SNIVYLAVFIGVYVALFGFTCWRIREAATRVSLYVAGGFTVIVITATPYAITGHLDIWFKSLFIAPWLYSTKSLSTYNISQPLNAAIEIAYFFTPRVTSGFVAFTLWFGAAIGVLCSLFLRRQSNAIIVLVFLGGIVTSVFLTGSFQDHYI